MRFAALRVKWFPGYLAGGSLTMAGDLVEHSITYWVMWQAFHSPFLAGFAIVAHWAPNLFFGVFFGGLADRFDCRRLQQIAMLLFMAASATWGALIALDILEPWHCMALLVVHGFAAAFWLPADQVMIYDIVGPDTVSSGVRLTATGHQLGMLVGPGIGGALLFLVGPVAGMFLNILLYVPLLVYLFRVPYTGHSRHGAQARVRLRLRDVVGVLREVPRYPAVLTVVVLQGAVALLFGNALVPLLPEFGERLGQAESGLGYGLLLVAMSTGAVAGGLLLEGVGRIRPSVRLAILATAVFAAALVVFTLTQELAIAVGALVIAGFGTIVSASTSQTIVQLEAPLDRRGRFLGAYGMTSLGLRVGAGALVGVLAGLLGVPLAFGLQSAAILLIALVLLAIVQARSVAVSRTPGSTPQE